MEILRVEIEINIVIGIQVKFAWKFIEFDDVGMNFVNLIQSLMGLVNNLICI